MREGQWYCAEWSFCVEAEIRSESGQVGGGFVARSVGSVLCLFSSWRSEWGGRINQQ